MTKFLDRQRAEEKKQLEDMRELERKKKYIALTKVNYLYYCVFFN